MKTKLLIEQHIHGAFGIDCETASVNDILLLSEKLLKRGIGGFFPTLGTASIDVIKNQTEIIKQAKALQKPNQAEILGIHLEGIFLNPAKSGIQKKELLKDLTIDNYRLLEDNFIKIVTLAPELDKNNKLTEYLKNKGVKVQAGHCTSPDIKHCDGVTHLFNAMGEISHRDSKTALSALINDDIYTEVIADAIHLSDDILNLVFKTKPAEKIILVGDTLALAYSNQTEAILFGSQLFYDGKSITDKNGTIGGSSKLLDDIVKILGDKGMMNPQFIENPYTYHNVDIEGHIEWNKNFEISTIKKGNQEFTNKTSS